ADLHEGPVQQHDRAAPDRHVPVRDVPARGRGQVDGVMTNAGGDAPKRPLTGAAFLDSLRGPREVWIYGERVKAVTAHQAFRNPSPLLAGLFDALHDPAQQPVDRHRPPDEVADVYVHVEKKTRAGIVVSGAKVVATGSALTHSNFIAHPTTTPIATKAFAAVFIATMDTPGVKLICRPSYAMT